jgi:replicative DNA helicase
MSEKTFGFLGSSFQQTLLKAILENKKYGEQIIDVIEGNYFDNKSFKFITQHIKEYYQKYGQIPDYQSLSQIIVMELGSQDSARVHLDTINDLKENTKEDPMVQEEALNFCKQQNLKKEIKNVSTIIENGKFQEYHKIEGIIQRALRVGLPPDETIDVFQNIDQTLEKDSRCPIPTGISGLDHALKGGLGRGELGVVLAPTGTGKTTLLSLFANTAYNHGYNVLQIFFEDSTDNIKRKHYTIWSGVAPDDQPDNKEIVKDRVLEKSSSSKGCLDLLKLSSDSVTISEIKTRIRKRISEGKKIDLLLIDYVDCISPEKSQYGEEWKGEGSVMRSLESMTNEFNVAIWTATQGNRESISSEVVNSDQMGGSIKKAQIAHVILSIGKTIEQKEHNMATMTLLKSRIGKDGIIWQNCKFDNQYLVIDTESQTTLLGHKEEKQKDNAIRAKEAFMRRNQMLNITE